MRLAHIGQPSSRKGAVLTDETKAKIRQARALQVHPRLVGRGITQGVIDQKTSNGLRWCSGKCKDFIPVDKFPKGSQKCADCKKEKHKQWRDKLSPEERQKWADNAKTWRDENDDRVRRHWLLKKYGVTPEWYGEKLAEQDSHCALCDAIVDGRKMPSHAVRGVSRQYLLVDHDHETGKARGLLCAKCNTALHRVEYTKDWATKALAYLAQYGTILTVTETPSVPFPEQTPDQNM
jgi:Recombination endonuclease VII